MQIGIPYGSRKLTLEPPSSASIRVVKPKEEDPVGPNGIIGAIQNPIGVDRISSLARHAKKVTIISDDHTRLTPVYQVLPPIFDELREADVERDRVTIMIASGMHRKMTDTEVTRKLGTGFAQMAVQHECNDEMQHRFIGITSRGTPCWINRTVVEADVRIGVGQISPSPFAGYSGGSKIVLPGVSAIDTINSNHDIVPYVLSNSRLGDLETPVREDMEEAARLAGLDVIVNLVLNMDGSIAYVVAGDPVKAHREGVKLARKIYEARIPRKSKISVTSANPYHIDLIQSMRAVQYADLAVEEGGTIIVVSPCVEGVPTNVYEYMLRKLDLEAILKMVARRQISSHLGSSLFAISKIIAQKAVVWVTEHANKSIVQDMGFKYAINVQEALETSLNRYGKDAEVTVFPYGAVTVPMLDKSS